MICGGTSSIWRAWYCSRAARGVSQMLATASWLSWMASWPWGRAARKKRVSKRRDMVGESRGVIQRDQGARWRVCSRRPRWASMWAKSLSGACVGASSAPACASANNTPHSSQASRMAATNRLAAAPAPRSGSANWACRGATGWSRYCVGASSASVSSTLPPGNTWAPPSTSDAPWRCTRNTSSPEGPSRSSTTEAASRGGAAGSFRRVSGLDVGLVWPGDGAMGNVSGVLLYIRSCRL